MQILRNNIKKIEREDVLIYSDLIDESGVSKDSKNLKIEQFKLASKRLKYGAYLETYKVKNEKDVRYFGKPKGSYFLINKIKWNDINKSRIAFYSKILFDCLCEIIFEKKYKSILVVGLGNTEIESDSLGGLVCNKLSKIIANFSNLFIYQTGVFGKTGIESFDIIDSICTKKKIDCVLVIDSLVSASTDRLNSSIQLTDAGISPGSGIKNMRKTIRKKDLNCDVFAIGVPLMIHASTFILSALCKHKIEYSEVINSKNDLNKKINNLFEDSSFDNYVVTFSTVKDVLEIYSEIIFQAILKFLIYLNF